MKPLNTLIATASLLLVTGAAFADSGKTRAEVQAEVQQARAAGTLDTTEARLSNPPQAQNSGLTRDQVRADVMAARAAGTLETNEADYTLGWSRAKTAKVEAQVAAKTSTDQQH